MEKYFMGIDNGGTMIKAALFTANGEMVSSASKRTPLQVPKEGYAERDMTELWAANCEIIKECINKADIDPNNILSVGCTGHGKGLYPWGKDGKPAYNAIASTDNRAASIVKEWNNSGIAAEAYIKTCQPVLACQPAALLSWLKCNEPAAYNNIKWVFEAKDYIRFMLTGEAFAEVTDYSGTSLLNLKESAFDRELLKLFGIEEIFDRLPPLKYSCELCGKVTAKTAELTGLAEGTAVCGGMFDIDACAIAMDVSDEEKICVITGTWSINEYISKAPVLNSPTTLNSLFCLPGYYLIEESSPTSAGNLEWFADTFMQEEKKEARQNGLPSYKLIDEMAQSVAPDESSILFLPFLYGTNAEGCGSAVFYGMNSMHEKKHMLRAVFEGVVFSHYYHLQRLFKTRQMPEAIRLAGGAANSKIWVKMFADVFGIPIEVVGVGELGAMGCAIAGAVAAGYYTDCKSAAANMVKISERVLPDQMNHEIYMKKYGEYREFIEKLSAK